jgi:hypothetical protein
MYLLLYYLDILRNIKNKDGVYLSTLESMVQKCNEIKISFVDLTKLFSNQTHLASILEKINQ